MDLDKRLLLDCKQGSERAAELQSVFFLPAHFVRTEGKWLALEPTSSSNWWKTLFMGGRLDGRVKFQSWNRSRTAIAVRLCLTYFPIPFPPRAWHIDRLDAPEHINFQQIITHRQYVICCELTLIYTSSYRTPEMPSSGKTLLRLRWQKSAVDPLRASCPQICIFFFCPILSHSSTSSPSVLP